MTLIGMDPGQVRELAGALSRSSGALREIRQQVGGELSSAGWDGVDAAQFREQWTRCSTDLMAAAEGLDSAQKVLLKQADEQEQASGAGDAGGVGNEGHVGTGQTMLQASGAGGAGAPGLPATGGSGPTGLPGKWDGEPRREGSGPPEKEPNSGSGPGLGQPVPGTKAPIPQPKPWQYSGDSELEGSGEHGQRDPNLGDYGTHAAAGAAADIASPAWPDAAKNLNHYLSNSGKPLDVNVDGMLEDLPRFQEEVTSSVDGVARKAVDAAKSSGATGPVTYPFVTNWEGHYAHKSDNENWFYATGGFSYATAGTVTVYPPTADNPEWTYKYEYQVHMADRYNWDGTKSTDIGPFHVTDKQLQELHQAGIAQEYDLVGDSSVRSGP